MLLLFINSHSTLLGHKLGHKCDFILETNLNEYILFVTICVVGFQNAPESQQYFMYQCSPFSDAWFDTLIYCFHFGASLAEEWCCHHQCSRRLSLAFPLLLVSAGSHLPTIQETMNVMKISTRNVTKEISTVDSNKDISEETEPWITHMITNITYNKVQGVRKFHYAKIWHSYYILSFYQFIISIYLEIACSLINLLVQFLSDYLRPLFYMIRFYQMHFCWFHKMMQCNENLDQSQHVIHKKKSSLSLTYVIHDTDHHHNSFSEGWKLALFYNLSTTHSLSRLRNICAVSKQKLKETLCLCLARTGEFSDLTVDLVQ